jgi:hypothetical protein
VQLADQYFQLGQQETYDFIAVNNQRSYEDSITSDADPFVDLFIRYDAKYDIYQRKIYSILELLADIGGLYQSLFVIGFVLVNFIAYRLFVASILKQIYQVKHDRNEGVE